MYIRNEESEKVLVVTVDDFERWLAFEESNSSSEEDFDELDQLCAVDMISDELEISESEVWNMIYSQIDENMETRNSQINAAIEAIKEKYGINQ